MTRTPLPLVSAKRVSCSAAAILGLRGTEPGSPRWSGDLSEKPGLRISSRLLYRMICTGAWLR
jgi:hypothetical protein